MPIHSKLEYVFRTFKFQFECIVKNADSDHANNRVENEVVNFIETEDFSVVVSDNDLELFMHDAPFKVSLVPFCELQIGFHGKDIAIAIFVR